MAEPRFGASVGVPYVKKEKKVVKIPPLRIKQAPKEPEHDIPSFFDRSSDDTPPRPVEEPKETNRRSRRRKRKKE